MLGNNRVSQLVKLYPLEWLLSDTDEPELLGADLEKMDMLEPAWKLILGNKAILPMLWEMFPNHKNLLAAYFIDPKVQLDKNEGSD